MKVSLEVHPILGEWFHLRLPSEQGGPQFLSVLCIVGKAAGNANNRNGLHGARYSHVEVQSDETNNSKVEYKDDGQLQFL